MKLMIKIMNMFLTFGKIFKMSNMKDIYEFYLKVDFFYHWLMCLKRLENNQQMLLSQILLIIYLLLAKVGIQF